MRGLLHFHQGWTDILNCLPLVNYYLQKYDTLDVIMREDAKTIFDFYIKDKKGIHTYYFSLGELNSLNSINPRFLSNFDIVNCDILFHGHPDCNRKDKYREAFNYENAHFVRKLYECYDIDYNNRIELFDFERDNEVETNAYNNFIFKNGADYIVYHDTNERKIDSVNISSNYKSVNLNGITNNIFETIKILEHAKEIHVIDSVWGTFCYLLDTRYGLFKDKQVYIYPFLADGNNRSGGCLRNKHIKQLEPKHLQNWNIVV
jgi:hypothetical protein